jgi:hypothetical protein
MTCRTFGRSLSVLAAVTLTLLPLHSPLASPWTLPEGDLALGISTDYQFARREWLQTGEFQRFPLDGRYRSANLRSGLRYGLRDRMEIGGTLSFSFLSYDADPIFLGDQTVDQTQVPGSRESIAANIISLDQKEVGLADLRLFVRNRLTPVGRVLAATEIELKLPTGYRQPAGTFRNDDPAQGTSDDVTLGDGQADITGRLLLGFSPTWDWFIRVDAGARARLFGPAPQVVGAFKTGYRVTPTFLPYAMVDAQFSVGEGESVGLSFITRTPEIPSFDYAVDVLETLEIRLDRDIVQAGLGAILSFGDRDIDLSYSMVVHGRNIAQLHIFSVGTNLRFPASP